MSTIKYIISVIQPEKLCSMVPRKIGGAAKAKQTRAKHKTTNKNKQQEQQQQQPEEPNKT